ncbi:MAG: Uncharacterised protein [Halieaceae bacterium]|nr:MAG: Uncharacterised protein [Halieaceae bacterium]
MPLEFCFNFTNKAIDIFDHIAEVCFVAFMGGGSGTGGVPVLGVWGRHERAVSEYHWVIN